jgi:hypothetical protein
MSEEKTLFKRVDYDVQGLIKYIEMGDIGLPDIQRPFVWNSAKVRDLFDSMYKGFPVGYLLFWDNDSVGGAKGIGIGGKQHAVPDRLIVDGQQRLTSLYAVLRGHKVVDANYREAKIEIAFRPRDGRFDVADAAIRRDPEFIADISTVWDAGSSYSVIETFLTNLTQRRDVEPDERKSIIRNIDRLYDLQHYPFTALEIAPTVSEEQVADIFVRINSQGVKLNQADFILTLMSVFWDQGRADLEAFCRNARLPSADGRPSPYNLFLKPQPDQLLRASVALGFRRARLENVYSILRGKDLETGIVSPATRDEQFSTLRSAQEAVLDLLNWHEWWKVVQQAGFLDASMISSETNLVYSYAMFLIGRRDFGADWFKLRRLMARWLFMNAVTARYSGSSETIMDSDLNRLRDLTTLDEFASLVNQQVNDTLTEDYWSITLPNDLATAGARSPYQFAYQAALNLLGARALFSQDSVAALLGPGVVGVKAGLERHHLFPRAYLRTLDIDATIDVNQIANLAIVGWEVNGQISDEAPHDYWPVWVQKYGRSAEELDEMRFWHALPEGWQDMDYHQFLAVRRQMMARVIRAGFDRLSDATILA